MPGRERGRSRIGGKKRLGRSCIKLQLMSPLTKWWTNMDGHKSSTKTDFFSSHQRLVFSCVWASIIHGTGVPAPNHARLPLSEVIKRGCHKRKMIRKSPNNLPVKLPWGVLAYTMDIYWSIHWGWVKTTGKVIVTADFGRNMYVRQGDDIYTQWCWWIVNPKRNTANHWTGVMAGKAKQNGGEWNG